MNKIFQVWDENQSNIMTDSESFAQLANTGFEQNKPIVSTELNSILRQNSLLSTSFLEYLAEQQNIDLNAYIENNKLDSEGNERSLKEIILKFLQQYLSKTTIEFVEDIDKLNIKINNQIYYCKKQEKFFVYYNNKLEPLFQTNFTLTSKIFLQQKKDTPLSEHEFVLYDRQPNTPIAILMFSPGGEPYEDFLTDSSYGTKGGAGGNMEYLFINSESADKILYFNIDIIKESSICTYFTDDLLKPYNSIQALTPYIAESGVGDYSSGGSGGGGAGFYLRSSSRTSAVPVDFFCGGSGTYGGGGGGGGYIMAQNLSTRMFGYAHLGGGSTGYKLIKSNADEDYLIIGGGGGGGSSVLFWPRESPQELDIGEEPVWPGDNATEDEKITYYNKKKTYDRLIKINGKGFMYNNIQLGGNGGRDIINDGNSTPQKQLPTNGALLPNNMNFISSLQNEYFLPINPISTIGLKGDSVSESSYGGGGGYGSKGGNGGAFAQPSSGIYKGSSGGGGGGGGFGSSATGGNGGAGSEQFYCGGGGGGGGYESVGGDGAAVHGGGGGGYGINGHGADNNFDAGIAAGGCYRSRGAYEKKIPGGPGICILFYFI